MTFATDARRQSPHRHFRLRLRAVFALLALSAGTMCAQILSPTGAQPAPPTNDWRDIQFGRVIPDEEYVDQPYIVRCDDGAWLCVLTTSGGG